MENLFVAALLGAREKPNARRLQPFDLLRLVAAVAIIICGATLLDFAGSRRAVTHDMAIATSIPGQ